MKKFSFILAFIALVFAGYSQSSMNIELLYNWQDASLPASAAYSNTYNEIWGVALNGREYAIIGSTMGTHFFDVTDPLNSVEVDFVEGAATGTQIVHRDYHDYKGYLYMVADEGPSTLQIVDLQYLPDSVHLVYDSDDLLVRTHNIFIDTTTAKLYACAISKKGNQAAAMSVFSLANPVQPVLMADWNGAGHVHDAYVINDTAFLNCGTQGLFIQFFGNPANPVPLGTLTSYPEQGYNHSGWYDPATNLYVFTDETWGQSLKVTDATDLADLQVESLINSDIHSYSIPHNVLLKDNIAYISYYFDGFYMYDISNPKQPVLIGFYDTYPHPHLVSYKGAWGVYPYLPSGNVLVSDMQSGLYVFDVQDAVGVEDIDSQEAAAKLYPNPVDQTLYLSEKLRDGYLRIFDSSGRPVFAGESINAVDVSTWPGGIYFVSCTNGNTTHKLQFIKL